MSNKFPTKISAMSHGSYAIAKTEDFGNVFVDNACPGDEVELEIFDQRNKFAFAELTNLISVSDLREPKPKCSLHKVCGSCQWQHISYPEQLNFKRQNLKDFLQQNKINCSQILEPQIEGMQEPYNYRNKIIYPVRVVESTGRLQAGYFKTKSNELVNIKYCPIQYEIFDAIVEDIKELYQHYQIPGKALRHILLRSNISQSELLLCFILRQKELDKQPEIKDLMLKIFEDIAKKYPAIKVFSFNYNDDSTNVILGKDTELLDLSINKDGKIIDDFAGIKLALSTTSFFQVNNLQFAKIITEIKQQIKNNCESDASELKILDAYCGIGTISLTLAKAIEQPVNITGIELVPSAIEDAKHNAALNDISRADFLLGSVDDLITQKQTEYDLVIINPPRKGCSKEVLLQISEQLKSKLIIYVSCNPATLTRDIKILEEKGYKLDFIKAFDMFPHSFHFETLAIIRPVL